ncbi:ABC-type spermidine/putrescine transport system, permease component I [Haladaptatus paucihalophilus DX253]|uniref:ABC-type spermidine/putrescine transport system, permease component I n=1 Tax=Haladaptatus paucihalophilus DX253 TaxID=797209 RepID=E7QWC0_HALPU|nr:MULTISPECIES: ABC transporter permease [Haladaptatus]EFW91016.1 ABC-type spermidine/putrescine transport system, permease component I [Haladaptatus paucihalophilus DX253]GKZ15416.1 spermidine/putrescine ABC transporter permease [Haladaptatus sp. T7]SHL39691.1 spermidine/putrescine transport system permease protein [Haladaptatus paucihalophilus DX253]
MSSEQESFGNGVQSASTGADGLRERAFKIRTAILRSGPVTGTFDRIKRHESILASVQAGLGLGWMFLFLFAPLLYIVTLSFWQRGTGGVIIQQFSLSNYEFILTQNVDLATLTFNNLYLTILWQSLKYGVFVTLGALALGYVPAYFLGRTVSKWKAAFLLLVVLPFWVPLIIRYYAWILVLGNKGLLVSMLGWVGIESGGFLYSDLAVISGLTQALLPFMILPIYNSVNEIDDSLIESAKTMGATPLRAFYEVTLPLTLPGISAGVILVFILSVGSYMAPALLGAPSNTMVANLIETTFGQNLDWPLASAMGVVYLLVLFVLISLFNRFVGLDDVFGGGSE